MERKAVSGMVFTLLLISMLTMVFGIQQITPSSSPKIWYVGPTKPPTYPDFAKIQEAINNASVQPGDIIEVLKNDTSPYYEYVVVNKSLTIRNYAGHQPIIDGKGTGTVVNITASNVVFSGFKIQSGENGLFIHGNSSGNSINNNIFTSNKDFSIYVGGLGNNSINGNNVFTPPSMPVSWARGIFICSANNTLKNNLITGNNCYNFGVSGSYDQVIDISNKVNGEPIYYFVNQSDKSVPSDAGYVAIVNSRNITVENLDVSFNHQGLLVVNSTYISVKDSSLRWNGYGVQLIDATNCIIENTETSYNYAYGINLVESNNNTIISNKVSYNGGFGGFGILLYKSNSSKIYRNNFVNNENQAVTVISTDNKWDNGREGNYWSDYTGLDNGADGRVAGDGIGDTNLPAPPGRLLDNYPLMEQWELVKVFDVGGWITESESGKAYKVRTFSDSTRGRASFKFNWTTGQLSFIITSGTSESFNIIIDRDLLDYNFTLLINDVEKNYIPTFNQTHISLYFSYSPGTYNVKIIGTRVGSIPGDLNKDGIVDIFDIVIIAANFGKQAVDE